MPMVPILQTDGFRSAAYGTALTAQAICGPDGFSPEIPGTSVTAPAEQCGPDGFRMEMPGTTATAAERC